MRKMMGLVLCWLMVSGVSQAAPYYTGVGCDEQGLNCTFGKPSGRVLNWSKKGTVAELGERCEKFITAIENRKNEIAKSRKIDLKYKNFTYSWSNDIQADGRAKIICRVELHSELPDVKLESKTVKNLFWVCENENSGGICRHYMKECEALRDQALNDKDVIDSTIYMGGSLLQGTICTVATAKVK